MTTRRKALGVLFGLLTSGGIFALGAEAVFRIVPRAIPAKALVYFEPNLRAKLAQGRFPTRADTVLMPRDDGGEPIRIFKPFTVRPYVPDVCGAVEQVPTDEIGFGNPPGIYASNATLAVVAIGDSYTFPTAVHPSDAWPHRLGAALDRTAYNLGRGGQGPCEYLQILKRFGLAKAPRTVVMNVYEGNDLRDMAEYLAYRSGQAPLVAGDGSEGKTGFLWRHSYAWNLAAGSVIYLRDHARAERLEGHVDYRFQVGAVPFNAGQGNRDEIVYARKAVAGEIAYAVFAEPLREFQRLGAAHGFQPVLAYTPSAAIVYAPVDFRDPEVGRVLDRFSREQRAYLRELAQESGLPFVDLTEPLRQLARQAAPTPENLLYFPGNIHLTARGHAAVAEILAAALADLP
jgi:hypothetical protein